jgi:hypothetical protein
VGLRHVENAVSGIAGRTVAEVSRTIRRSTADTAELLAELERDGIAQETDGLWRLTDEAETRFGRAFRDLGAIA